EVQIAVAPPWPGSIADTAWMNRPSSASRVSLVPFCWAGSPVGSPNAATVIGVAVLVMLGIPVALSVTLYRLMKLVFSMLGNTVVATTQPVVDGSVCCAGTGV